MLFVMALAGAVTANAQMILVTASFSGTPTLQGGPLTAYSIAGNFTATYDASSLTGVGAEYLTNFAPTSFNLTVVPTTFGAGLDGFSPTAANTWVTLGFTNGTLDQVQLGDRTDVLFESVLNMGTRNDFAVWINSSIPDLIIYSEISNAAAAYDFNPTTNFSTSAIPEPSTYAGLLGLAALALAALKRAHGRQAACAVPA